MVPKGLTTEEAKQLLLNHIRDKTLKYEASSKRGLSNYLFHLITPGNLASTVALILLVPEFSLNWQLFAGIVPWFTVNIIIEIILFKTEIRRKAARLYETMNEFIQSIEERNLIHRVELEQPEYLIDPPSSSLLPILRDGKWLRLPQNVIVPGDVFKIPYDHPLPCEVENVHSDSNQQEYSATLPDIVGEETNIDLFYNTWVSVGFGCDGQLDAFLDSEHKIDNSIKYNQNKEDDTKGDTNTFIAKNKAIWDISDSSIFINFNSWGLFFFGMSLSLLVFFMSYFISGFPGYPVLRSYTISAYVIILCSSPIKDALFRWIKVWGNVKLQSLFEWHHESRFMGEMDPESSHISTFELSSSADSVDSDMAASQIPLFRQLRELFSVFMRGFDGRVSLLNTLSSVTLLCFIDHIGILSEATAKPVEIAIPFKSKIGKYSKSHCEKRSSQLKRVPTEDKVLDSDPNRSNPIYQTDLLILDVHESSRGVHPGMQYIRFTNDKEKGSEPVLRPICFAASFTQIPRYKMPSLHKHLSKIEDVYLGCFANSATLSPYNDCKCGLSVGMMLNKKYIRKFRIMRTIIAIDHMPRNSKHYDGALIFFIVKDLKSKTFQLFVKGKVSLLFDFKTKMQFMTNADEVFNMNILTRGLRRKIRNLSIQWISSGMEPIAYAYKPLSLTETNILINNLPLVCIFCIASSSYECKKVGIPEPFRHSRPQFIQLCKFGESDMIFTHHPLRNEWINAFKGSNLLSKIPIIFDRDLPHPDRRGGFNEYISLENLGLLSSSIIGNDEHGSRGTPCDEFNRSWNSDDGNSHHSDNLTGSSSMAGDDTKTPHFEESGESDFEVKRVPQNNIFPPFIGDLLCKSLDNLCFLGMFATKLQCPKEVPARIQNLHEAGIRMVYFSKGDERSTRKLGSMLGLETNWNCMISLSESRTATLVNRDGNVVLPSGIENINKHINEIDDIPLKVSLYFNCTVLNIVQMMKILRENGETIMCVGSGLRPFNFFIFNAADISLSISLGYHPVCKFCRGLRWRGIARSHIFEPMSPDLQVSASLTSLPCALKTAQVHKVADPYFVMEMLFEVFKEARRLDSNVQQAMGFAISSFWGIILLFLFEIALSSPPLIKCSNISLMTCFYIPLLSASLMASPPDSGAMERMPSRIEANKQRISLWPLKVICRVIPNMLIVGLFFMYSIWDVQNIAIESMGDNKMTPCNFITASSVTCINKINKCLKDVNVANGSNDNIDIFRVTQEFTSMFAIIYIVLGSHSWVNRYESIIATGIFSNVKWLIASVGILTLQGVLMYTSIKKYRILYSKIAILGAALWIPILLIIAHILKRKEMIDKDGEQKYLRLLFSTKLGMWSPK